ncbi:MAG: 4-hydroxy-tetrahydrodipicolinate reductase [Syntrophales bacterium]|nr:4-hydroxy-tetrahydrodipicolinate reductase [Syntrophales bacterium]MCK9528074.1 4-hydroxy-tetrahydrodipicolinate reductase [Syntrophales bacterium]MDX9922330.1 4-hydroxy-tetrahydrodipicolinate reductase [Syntrophales bacterium]
MIRVIVMGAGGRMGCRICSLLDGAEDLELAGAVEIPGHPLVGEDIGDALALSARGVKVSGSLEDCVDAGDVIIDFTHHDAVVNNLEITARHKKAAVIGTTGLTARELEAVVRLAAQTRCVLAPNMSVGVNVMFRMLDSVARILGDDYDVEIVEAHHNQKKDAPSGTAVMMAQVVARALGRNMDDVGVYERRGMTGARTKQEIGIQTIRAGDIVGEHTVIFGGMGERLEFIHRAHSRDNFARGALRAARWVVNQPKGLYDMQDVLGLKE